ncbi:glycoside hydrolase family 6 protein, partial [Streptomyces sp. NPDC054835]
MKFRIPGRRSAALAAALAACAAWTAVAPAASAGTPGGGAAPEGRLAAATRFYVDPDSGAARQAVVDEAAGSSTDAANMRRLAALPQAAWFTGSTPEGVRAGASALVARARAAQQVPVLVAYDIPGRDCGLYSSGGAPSSAAYRDWIGALADGVGEGPALVILEPDALAALPRDCAGNVDPTGALTAERLADLDFAVTTLKRHPGTSVYLDAGNSQWKAVGDIARRLIDAGVAKADGFSLNVSNFQPTDQLTRYGTWVSQCVWFATRGPDWARGHTDWCASQYYSAAAPNDGAPGNAVSAADPATWHWTDAWYEQATGSPAPAELLHFVVDTSRNGRGPWTPAPGTYADPETWCNPPGRGMGPRPTADTGVPLADAYLY